MRIEVRGYLSPLVGSDLFPQRSSQGGKVVAEEGLEPPTRGLWFRSPIIALWRNFLRVEWESVAVLPRGSSLAAALFDLFHSPYRFSGEPRTPPKSKERKQSALQVSAAPLEQAITPALFWMVQVPSPFVHEQFHVVSIPNRPPLILAVEPSIWTFALGGTFIVLKRISAPNRGSEAKRPIIPIAAFIVARSIGDALVAWASNQIPGFARGADCLRVRKPLEIILVSFRLTEEWD
jgi:hypothetical protein